MSNTKHPVVGSIRILPQNTEFLDRKVGTFGEILFDNSNNTLRIYNGLDTGGVQLLKADLSNAEIGLFAETSSSEPSGATVNGSLWFNTVSSKLFVRLDDEWVEPAGTAGGATEITELTDVTISDPAIGQVLKYNGTNWVNDDETGSIDPTPVSLEDLENVIIDTPINGQVLKYDGINWINDTDISSEGSMGGVSSIVAGTGVTIEPVNGLGNVTINALSISEFANLTDSITATLTIDKIAYQAITRLDVTPNGATAYLFTQYSGNNPTIYGITGTTIAFNLAVSGHPFLIQDAVGTEYNTGLVHVSTAGVISTGAAAQGQRTGTLYWQIPKNAAGTYRYQCSLHVPMVGAILIKDIAAL